MLRSELRRLREGAKKQIDVSSGLRRILRKPKAEPRRQRGELRKPRSGLSRPKVMLRRPISELRKPSVA